MRNKIAAGVLAFGALGAANYAYEHDQEVNFAPLAKMPAEVGNDPYTYVCDAPQTDAPQTAETCNKDTAWAYFGGRPKIPVKLDELTRVDPENGKTVKENLIEILTAAEDQKFFEHNGVDRRGFMRAILTDIKCLCIAEGGSTIDSQMAGVTYMQPAKAEPGERSSGLVSKLVREVPEEIHERRLARTVNEYLEQKYTKEYAGKPGWTPEKIKRAYKEEIAEDYINNVAQGRGSVGFGAASYATYGKPLNELSYPELIKLVSDLTGPKFSDINVPREYLQPETTRIYEQFIKENGFSKEGLDTHEEWHDFYDHKVGPLIDEAEEKGTIPKSRLMHIRYGHIKASESYLSTHRYNGVINKLVANDVISEERAKKYRANAPSLVPFEPIAERNYDRANRLLARPAVEMILAEAARGINANTPNKDKHVTAESLKDGGFKIYTTLNPKTQEALSRVIRNELPLQRSSELEVAAVVHDEKGRTTGLVGSKDPNSQFNTVTQPQNIGSRGKPFIWAAAYEAGVGPHDEFPLKPVVIAKAANGADSLKVKAPDHCKTVDVAPSPEAPWPLCTPHEGLIMSSNKTAAHMANEGGLENAVKIMRGFGMDVRKDWGPSAVILGTEIPPDQINAAVNGLVHGQGESRPPRIVSKVTETLGTLRYEAPEPTVRNVVDREVAKQVTEDMVGVVQRGTAAGTIPHSSGSENKKAAGKTGTSDESEALGFTVATCNKDKAVGNQTTTISIANRNNSQRIPDSVYESSRSVAQMVGRFLTVQGGSTQPCSVVAPFNE